MWNNKTDKIKKISPPIYFLETSKKSEAGSQQDVAQPVEMKSVLTMTMHLLGDADNDGIEMCDDDVIWQQQYVVVVVSGFIMELLC